MGAEVKKRFVYEVMFQQDRMYVKNILFHSRAGIAELLENEVKRMRTTGARNTFPDIVLESEIENLTIEDCVYVSLGMLPFPLCGHLTAVVSKKEVL